MGTFAIALADFHFGSAQGIVAGSNIELWRQQQVGANDQMFAYAIFPVVKTNKRGRQPQGRPQQTLGDTYLQVERGTLKIVFVG